MQLCDEYHKRHSLNFIPAKRQSKSYLLLLDIKPVGSLMSISWLNKVPLSSGLPEHGPGVFAIKFFRPIRNENLLNYKESLLYWDEYERYILDWSVSIKKRYVIQDEQKLELAAWSMFIYMNDSYFANPHLVDLVFSTIDSNSSLLERHRSLQVFLKILKNGNYFLYASWKKFSVILEHSDDWLCRLVLMNGK